MKYSFLLRGLISTGLFWNLAVDRALCRAEGNVGAAPPRESAACGPNSVLMFLVLCGADADEESLRAIPLNGGRGASLLELSEFAAAHGVRAEVREFAPSEVSRMPLPAIWLMKGEHFLVVYGFDPDGILALDGTTGMRMRIGNNKIEKFSGYALIRSRGLGVQVVDALSASSLLPIALTLSSFAMLAILIVDALRRRSKSLALGGLD